MEKYTLITGATSGIGYEIALTFAKNKHNLFLVSRNLDKLRDIKSSIEEEYKVKIKIFNIDLSQETSAETIYNEVMKENIIVENLINNAGFGSFGLFHEVDFTKDLEMIDVNIKSLTAMLKFFIPHLIQNGGGGIMNVASTAAFQPGPLMSVYYASKAYVLSLSQALRVELKPYNIRVITLCPGPTATNFQSKAQVKKADIAKNAMMTADKVAKEAYVGFIKGKDIIIPGSGNKFLVYSSKLLPRKLISYIILRVNKP